MHILIVDDMYTNRLRMGIVIRAMGYTFQEAENGKIAIEKLQKSNFDLILMDIEMPVMNGLETTRHIRKFFSGEKRETKIIAITAHNPEDFFNDYKESGFDDLISKPLTKEKLSCFIPKR